MAKIRSTLDIVMERTKNVSMTDEDRSVLRHKEISENARAWVSRYLDAKMSLKEMEDRLSSAGSERGEMLEILKKDLVAGLSIDGDNTRALDALEALAGIDREKVARSIRDTKAKLDDRMADQRALLKANLEKTGISGSAVVPNIAKSKPWQDMVLSARERMIEELGQSL